MLESKQIFSTTTISSVLNVARLWSSSVKKLKRCKKIIARQKGFRVTHHKLELYGWCKTCKIFIYWEQEQYFF